MQYGVPGRECSMVYLEGSAVWCTWKECSMVYLEGSAVWCTWKGVQYGVPGRECSMVYLEGSAVWCTWKGVQYGVPGRECSMVVTTSCRGRNTLILLKDLKARKTRNILKTLVLLLKAKLGPIKDAATIEKSNRFHPT